MTTRLRMRHYGESKTTDHESPYAAHAALLATTREWNYSVGFDNDPIKGTMSGELWADQRGDPIGSWIIGEVKE